MTAHARLKSSVATTIAATVVMTTAAIAGTGNIVANGGFENELDGWLPFFGEASTDHVRSGSFSLKATVSNQGSGLASGALSTDPISVTPGELYRFSAWIYCESGDDLVGSMNWAGFRVQFGSPKDVWDTISIAQVKILRGDDPRMATDQWVYGEALVLVPPQAQTVTFYPMLMQEVQIEGGTVWIDDLAVEPVERDPSNPLINGEFETGVNGCGCTGWPYFNGWFNQVGNCTPEYANIRSGETAVRIAESWDKASGYLSTMGQEIPDVEPGTMITATAHGLSNSEFPLSMGSNKLFLRVQAKDADGKLLITAEDLMLDGSDPRIMHDTWTEGRVELTAPEGTASMEVLVQLQQVDESSGWAYVDDVSVILEEPVGCIADLDLDGIVSGTDLGILLSQWGQSTADIDGDGTTNGIDLGILLANWGNCP